MDLQPLLHDLLVATMAPTQAWSAPVLQGQHVLVTGRVTPFLSA